MLSSKLMVMGVAALGLTANSSAPHLKSACGLAKANQRHDLVNLPFREIDGRIYVEVLVNGKGPYIFALDTGASGMGRADSGLVTALDLPFAQDSSTSDGVEQSRVKTVRVRSLGLGKLERRNVEVITRDYRSRMMPEAAFAGILGREFFSDGMLIIDYGRRTVSFTRDRKMTPAMAGAMPYTKAFRVPVTIGGMATLGNLDTGANVALILPLHFYSKISAEPLGEKVPGTLTNTRIETSRVTIKDTVQVGDVTASGLKARVSEQFPEVLVGAHFLRNHVLIIDQRSQTVALCPAAPNRTA